MGRELGRWGRRVSDDMSQRRCSPTWVWKACGSYTSWTSGENIWVWVLAYIGIFIAGTVRSNRDETFGVQRGQLVGRGMTRGSCILTALFTFKLVPLLHCHRVCALLGDNQSLPGHLLIYVLKFLHLSYIFLCY
jgi:hypothetical protein